LSILSDFEDRVASAVEGLFAGAFRSPVQPAELAKALGKAMDDERMVGVGKVYAPVTYTVALSPEDADKLRDFMPVLAGELATFLAERAREHGYHTASKPSVAFTRHNDLRLGRFRVSAGHADAGPRPEEQPPLKDASEDAPVAPNEAAGFATVTVGEDDHDVALHGDRMVIGRLTGCDICLDDANVSRRHAELLRIGEDWFVADLESTNGTMVNGDTVSKARLREGDVIEIGVTRLTFHAGG
jgi:hypothetical protein